MAKEKNGKSAVKAFTESVQGIADLAFLAATGTAAYVLWFSSDSLTLNVIAGILAVRVAVQALAMATKR